MYVSHSRNGHGLTVNRVKSQDIFVMLHACESKWVRFSVILTGISKEEIFPPFYSRDLGCHVPPILPMGCRAYNRQRQTLCGGGWLGLGLGRRFWGAHRPPWHLGQILLRHTSNSRSSQCSFAASPLRKALSPSVFFTSVMATLSLQLLKPELTLCH